MIEILPYHFVITCPISQLIDGVFLNSIFALQYRMPEAYDQEGGVNQEKRFSVAMQRYRLFTFTEDESNMQSLIAAMVKASVMYYGCHFSWDLY